VSYGPLLLPRPRPGNQVVTRREPACESEMRNAKAQLSRIKFTSCTSVSNCFAPLASFRDCTLKKHTPSPVCLAADHSLYLSWYAPYAPRRCMTKGHVLLSEQLHLFVLRNCFRALRPPRAQTARSTASAPKATRSPRRLPFPPYLTRAVAVWSGAL